MIHRRVDDDRLEALGAESFLQTLPGQSARVARVWLERVKGGGEVVHDISIPVGMRCTECGLHPLELATRTSFFRNGAHGDSLSGESTGGAARIHVTCA